MLKIGTPPNDAVITIVSSRIPVSAVYELGGIIAEGGSAEVRRSRPKKETHTDNTPDDSMTDDSMTDVAVKQMKLFFVGKTETAAAFANEAHVLKRFHHTNIVRVFAAFIDTAPSVVMEFVDGGNLTSAVSEGATKGREPAIFRQLLLAVAHIHEHRVVHHDIKPDNVLLDRKGVVKLADFGLARCLRDVGPRTVPLGTLWFTAPELLTIGQPGYGTPVDLWACGLVLRFLSVTHTLTLRVLPSRDGLPGGDEADATLAPSLQDLLRGLLRPDPADRMTAAQALQCDWLRAPRVSTPDHGDAKPRPRQAPSPQRRREAVSGAARLTPAFH